MSLSLRVASPADLPAVVLLMNAAFRGVGPAAGWNSEADLIDGNRTTETALRQELADQPHTLLLIAHSTPDDSSTDNRLLGCVSLEPASAHVCISVPLPSRRSCRTPASAGSSWPPPSTPPVSSRRASCA